LNFIYFYKSNKLDKESTFFIHYEHAPRPILSKTLNYIKLIFFVVIYIITTYLE